MIILESFTRQKNVFYEFNLVQNTYWNIVWWFSYFAVNVLSFGTIYGLPRNITIDNRTDIIPRNSSYWNIRFKVRFPCFNSSFFGREAFLGRLADYARRIFPVVLIGRRDEVSHKEFASRGIMFNGPVTAWSCRTVFVLFTTESAKVHDGQTSLNTLRVCTRRSLPLAARQLRDRLCVVHATTSITLLLYYTRVGTATVSTVNNFNCSFE